MGTILTRSIIRPNEFCICIYSVLHLFSLFYVSCENGTNYPKLPFSLLWSSTIIVHVNALCQLSKKTIVVLLVNCGYPGGFYYWPLWETIRTYPRCCDMTLVLHIAPFRLRQNCSRKGCCLCLMSMIPKDKLNGSSVSSAAVIWNITQRFSYCATVQIATQNN